jgi:hypothetical protein
MAGNWSDWNKITEYLKLAALDGRYTKYVEALLKLIPLLQEQPGFEDVQPGVQHLTLTLGVVDGKREIHVDWEGSDLYNIYLDHATYNVFGSGDFYGDRVVVPSNEVVSTLQRYLVRLRLESLGDEP